MLCKGLDALRLAHGVKRIAEAEDRIGQDALLQVRVEKSRPSGAPYFKQTNVVTLVNLEFANGMAHQMALSFNL